MGVCFVFPFIITVLSSKEHHGRWRRCIFCIFRSVYAGKAQWDWPEMLPGPIGHQVPSPAVGNLMSDDLQQNHKNRAYSH